MSIVVLTGSNCSKCDTLQKVLDKSGIEYDKVHMMSTEGMKLVRSSGVKSIPQIFIDGELVDKSYLSTLGVVFD